MVILVKLLCVFYFTTILCQTIYSLPPATKAMHEEVSDRTRFQLFTNPKLNWTVAFRSCETQNAELLWIDTKAEFLFIREFIQRAGIPNLREQPIWTCGSNLHTPSRHIWMTNGKAIDKTLWGPEEPSKGPNDNCDQLWWPRTKDADWDAIYLNDAPCNQENYFICRSFN